MTNIYDNIASKTLGPQSARLVTTLHDRGHTFFRLEDIREITGASKPSARTFARDLVGRGIATRLKPGLFVLVPFELGHERQYVGDPLLIAREMMNGKPHYVSHASAMEIHGLLTQPHLGTMITTPVFHRSLTVQGLPFRFVRCRKSDMFGLIEHWASKQETVLISSLERTLIDGLKSPGYCGGILEVAKGLWIRRQDVNIPLLIRYGQKLKVGAVLQRLGFLLQTYELGDRKEQDILQKTLTDTYVLLDPTLPAEGHYLRRWRLRLNVTPEEMLAVVRT